MNVALLMILNLVAVAPGDPAVANQAQANDLSTSPATAPQADPTTLPASDANDWVSISSTIDENMFPKSWRSTAKVSALSDSEARRAQRAVEHAMRKYPVRVIWRHLAQIYLVQSLEISGRQLGGTMYEDRIYVANGGQSLGYSDEWLERVFHHEFSSVLFRQRRAIFPKDRWLALNPQGFEYLGNGLEAIGQSKNSRVESPESAARGFIYEYSQASLEEDFNSIAERLFIGGGKFWTLVDAMPKIRAKVDLAIEFYGKLDPLLTESYFRSLTAAPPVPVADMTPSTDESKGIYPDSKIRSMILGEVQDALATVAAARREAGETDPECAERLRFEFDLLLKRMKVIRETAGDASRGLYSDGQISTMSLPQAREALRRIAVARRDAKEKDDLAAQKRLQYEFDQIMTQLRRTRDQEEQPDS